MFTRLPNQNQFLLRAGDVVAMSTEGGRPAHSRRCAANGK